MDCTRLREGIQSKKTSVEKQIESIRFLLEQTGSPKLPLELIFQVDAKDSGQVSRRLEEVKKLTDLKKILESKDLEELFRCKLDDASKTKLEDVADHILQLNLLKVKFFEFPKDKRLILVENYVSQRTVDADKTSVKKEVEKAEGDLAAAQKKLIKTSEDLNGNVLQSKDETITVAKTTLQQYLADYANEQLSFLKSVGEKKEALDKIRLQLNALIQKEQNADSTANDLLLSANLIWEQTADFISGLFKGLEIATTVELPDPLSPVEALSKEQSEDHSDYIKSYEAAKSGRLEMAQKRTQIVSDLKSQAFQLLTEAGRLRSRLFSKCDQLDNCDGHRSFNSKNIFDLIREIEIIPIKIQAGGVSKTLEFKSKLSAGLDGWIDLLQQIVALFVLLLIPLTLFKLLSWFNVRLDLTRKSVLSRSMMDFRKRTSIALWISRVNPFVPTVGMALGIWIARKIIETTDIRELSQILFYFQLYFIYRIFKLAIQIILGVLFSSDSVSDVKNQRLKAESSAKHISRLIFAEYAFLFLIETTVRRALLYGLLSDVIFYFNVGFIFWETYRWNQQILDAYRCRFSKHNRYLQKITKSKVLNILSCPLLLLAVVLHDLWSFFYTYLIRLDFFKKIHSEIFRRRIEADAEEDVKKSPSKEYLEQFDYYLPADRKIFVNRSDSSSDKIASTIRDWSAGRISEDLIVLVGNRGMGKTTVLNSVSKTLGDNVEVFRPPPKTLKTIEFYKFLTLALGAEVDSLDSLLKFDDRLQEKKVILVDDIQNLFLGEIGGFEIYKLFIEILSLKTKNIFWCLSINSRSWSYLKGALGQEHLYGKIIELQPWKDSEIQELILTRHRLTQFSRQFEKSIKAYGASGDELGQQSETQFFRLLWGQSRGNPRSALMYWISAISQIDSDKIVVGVPSFVNSSLVSTMSDDSLFLLASIARHESLTQEEMQVVTHIQNTVIRKCMKEALDKGLVWFDEDGRYRISSRAQYVIDYFLIGKNFLYE